MKQLSGVLLAVLLLAGCVPAAAPKATIPKLDISVVSADVQHDLLTFYLGITMLNLEGAKAMNLEYTIVVSDIDNHPISHVLQSNSALPASVDAEGYAWALFIGNTLELPYRYGVMLEWEDEGGQPYSWATVGDFTFEP